MPTVISHAVVAAGLYRFVAGPAEKSRWGMGAAVVLAMLPDADVAWWNWTEYGRPWGHRGMTHSIAFAVVAGALVAWLLRKRVHYAGGTLWLAITLAACAATHGLLDACTDGGRGVGFWLPFDDRRVFFGLQPIPVSPISVDVSDPAVLRVLAAELILVWPIGIALWLARRPPSVRRWGLAALAASFCAWQWAARV